MSNNYISGSDTSAEAFVVAICGDVGRIHINVPVHKLDTNRMQLFMDMWLKSHQEAMVISTGLIKEENSVELGTWSLVL